MADINNGSSDGSCVKTEEPDQKSKVNTAMDAVEDSVAEETKPTEIKTEVKTEVHPTETEVKTEIKLDPETLAKKVKRQIEYYFGDYNLPTDKFLREQVKEDDGWVPLETMLKFKRLASVTQDPTVIVSALANSQLIQINDDKTAIRRHPDKPLPVENEARRKEVLARSVYVKGFPLENFTVDSALDFFEKYGSPDDVTLRYINDKAAKKWLFKGSVFVKYPTKEAAAAFLALEDVKYEDTPLIKLWQEDYISKKRKERLEMKLNKHKRPHEDYKESTKDTEERGLPKNATLRMTKCPEDLTREVLKEKVEEMGVTVAFIDFNKGDTEGYIRLHEANSVNSVMKECEEGVLKLQDGLEVELKVLEGEEEASFLESAQDSINERRAKGGKNNQRGRRGGGRGGGRGYRGGGGRGHWRNRRENRDRDRGDEPPAKIVKVDSGE